MNGTARRGVVLGILLAWLTTLPMGAAFATAVYWLLGSVGVLA